MSPATTPTFAPSGAFTIRSMSFSMGSPRRRGRIAGRRLLRRVEDRRGQGEVDDVELVHGGGGAGLLLDLRDPEPLGRERRERVHDAHRPDAPGLELREDVELLAERGLLVLDVLHLADDPVELGDLVARLRELLLTGLQIRRARLG